MAFRSKTRLYVSIALVIGLVVAYSNSQPHGHTHGGNGDHGHAHDDHGHAHNENPAYKYSRAANEPAKQPQQQHHGHSHDDDHHGHHHAHSHGNGGGHHHAHSHGSGGGHHHAHSHGSGEQQKRAAESTTTKPAASAQKPGARDRFTIALHAMGSTALISIAPFLILFFIPLNDNNIENQALLKVLLAFASGSLLGDAFLHLIPHSLEPHDHSSHAHSHSHQHNHGHDHHDHSQQTNVGLWVMSGILTFLLVEKLIVSVKGDGHSHSHSPQTEKEKIGAAKKNEEKSASDEDDDDSKPKKSSKKDTPKKKVEEKKKEEPKHEGIKVAGYLNLAADFAHNFTDGLAIGASFLAGQNLGIITTFTILFHEVPHEIGDFAILIQSGCSKKKAIFLQLVTALGACSGTLLSLLFESAMSGFATSCILPFTAGGFIYIATVTIIPELKESTGFFQSIKEILALVAGVGMMIVISYME